MMRLIKDDGAIFYNHKFRIQQGKLLTRMDIIDEFPLRQMIIWNRKCGMNFNANYFLPVYEVIFLIAKPKFKLKKGHGLSDVWEVKPEKNNAHPAPFPLELPTKAIGSTTAQTVLDPFLGSGTTAIACHNLKRKFIGSEINKEYYDNICDRIKTHTNTDPINKFFKQKK
jgi:modification methylase